jgi:pimeloyl-ACP methyl ester carboxylesterase
VPGAADSRALVIIGHGLTSDRERPWSQALSAALQAEGLASVRIAFSGNGDSEGRFEDSNITKEFADLGAVLDAVAPPQDDDRGRHGPIAYVGHSMGAAVGVLRAARDDRLAALVSLAGMVHTAEFMERLFGHLAPGEPMLEKPSCPFSLALRDDLTGIGSVVERAPDIRVPWLLVHGTADDVVLPRDSRDIHARAADNSRLVELDGVDHSFSRPLVPGGEGLDAMLEIVVPWLVERLTARC